MLKLHKVTGYQRFLDFIANLQTNGEPVNVYFSGSKDSSGKSWCEDCNVAEPHVTTALKTIKTNAHFITVDVGDRAYWKDSKNPFRTDKDLHLQVIPTLIKWRDPKRLEGDQLLNNDLLDMFFNDDED